MPPIALLAVPYGPPATRALHRLLAAAKAAEPLAPVTVVVPSNHVGVTARRLLASDRLGPVSGRGRGLVATTFLTPYRLAELLGAADLAGQGRRPVSTPVLTAGVRQVLAQAPGLFTAVADHPATESALVTSYRELRDLPPGALDAVARTGARAAEVVRIHRATRAALEASWSDEEDLMVAATARLAADPAAATALGTVVVHLPQRLSLHAAALLRTVARHTPTTVVAGTTGDPAADAEVTTALARLGLDLPPDPTLAPLSTVAPDRTRIVSASDADDEVRHAVRAVVEAVRAGTPLDRIAVLHTAPDPYARLVHEHLGAAGISVNGASPVPLAARVAGRVLLGLFALPEQGWSRHAVLAWLGTGPLRHDGRPAPVAAWERISRDAGVVGGRDQWDRRLLAHADSLRSGADDIAAPGADGARVAERWRQRADQALALRDLVLGLVDELERAAAAPRRWPTHGRWAHRLLDRLLGPASQRAWPEAERRAGERVELALDRLGALGDVEGPVGLDVVVRTLAVELETDLGRVGRFGEGVLVGSLPLGVGLDLDLVVVVGLAEGLAPRPARDDSLLPDHERRAADGVLALRRDGTARQHRELLATLAAATGHVLTFPRGDLRGSRERSPSRWLLDVASALAPNGERWWADHLTQPGPWLDDAPWVHHARSFDHGLRHLSVPATPQEHRLRSLLATGAGPRALAPLRALGDPVLATGVEMVEGRSAPRLTRFDGNLAGLTIASPANPSGDRIASPTGLERWATCPFDYFLQSVLGVREVENPEDAATISALDRGSLAHHVLERFIGEILTRPADQRPGPFDRWTAADRARLRAIAEETCDDYERRGLTGQAVYWQRDRGRILADLDATLTFDEERRQVTGSRHFHAEMGFGRPGDALPPVALPLPDGRHVRFRGQVDRIDRADDGTVIVADYKTGRDRSYASLSETDPDQGGTRLQLAVYGAAARAAVDDPTARVRAEYWFVSARGGFRVRGYELTPAVSERISETLGLVVAGIEAGAFPAHPTDRTGAPFNPCWSCDPDFLGVVDLRRAWEAMADDPALAGYRTLIDPERRIDAGTEEDGDG